MPKPLILNVDDHEPARYARSRLLREAGFEVFEAGTGRETLRLLAERSPDLVLLDINLPDTTGIEICRAIKGSPATSSIMVLHVSASAIAAPQATKALNAGADSYLTEPVDSDVLVATIRALLRLRRSERELARSNAALREANAEFEKLNEALRRSNEDLEHFAYFASHDLQEPLRTIVTHAQLLERGLRNRLDGSDADSLHYVEDSARRMSALIEDVLTYSRAGRTTQQFCDVPLDNALLWARMNLMQTLAETGAELESEPLPVVWGDSTQLAQVFQNLIGNALKYRSPGVQPRIRIRAEKSGSDCWMIFVEDNGIGIDAEFHDRIFGPFKRLHGREVPGTGIGLALCRRIVQAHGGEIRVRSKPGEGSTFMFSLRAADSETPAENSAADVCQ